MILIMTELQAVLLEMLKEIDGICKKNDITYYLIGGSALGAVRHNGFLPWDDDADIVMTRENWLRFEEIIDSELPPNRELMCWERTPEYPAVFARYTNKETTCIVHSLGYSPISWGLMIDIFILTPIPNEPAKRKKFHQYMRDYGELLNPFFPINLHSSVYRYRFLKFMEKIFGNERVIKYIYHKIYGYSEDTCSHYSYSYSRIHIIYDKTIFQSPRYYLFEGYPLPVPTKAEEHFRILFGEDWMMLPESQISAHNATFDLNRPFYKYTRDYLTVISNEKLMKAYRKWKDWRLYAQKMNLYKKNLHLVGNFSKNAMEFEKEWGIINEIVLSEFDLKDFASIDKHLCSLYPKLVDKQYIKEGLKVPLSEQQLEIFIFMFNWRGEYYHAKVLIDHYLVHKSKNKMIESLVLLTEYKIEYINSSDKDSKEEAKLERFLLEYPSDHTLRLFKLQWLLKNHTFTATEIYEYIQECLTLFPDDGNFLKYLADYYYQTGQEEKAFSIYKDAEKKTKNGLILLEIAKMIKKESDNK
jgi:phosphorylcholine metabolism protein LicD